MFAPPERLPTTLLAVLPKNWPLKPQSARFGDIQTFIEGPAVDREGRFYFADVPQGRIFRISNGQTEPELVADYDGEPNGLKVHADGRIFVADNRRGIVTVDPNTGAAETWLDRVDSERLIGPNDLYFTRSGALFFTDQGQSDIRSPHGRIVRVSPDGKAEFILRGIPGPNGLVVSSDEKTLYIAVTRQNAIWRAPLLASGGVGLTGVHIQMSGGIGPDGIALDQAGNMLVAHPGMGCLWLFSSRGEPLFRWDSCTSGVHVTNMAFGGPENRTLYITESMTNSILVVEAPHPGQLLFGQVDGANGRI